VVVEASLLARMRHAIGAAVDRGVLVTGTYTLMLPPFAVVES
jgi:hypothetical protein